MADMLASPEDLASLLQEDLDRATAELLLECATAVVQAVVGGQRILEVTETATLYLDAYDSGPWLYLPQRPVSAISSALIGVQPITDYTVQLSRARLYRVAGWRAYDSAGLGSPSTVVVTYTHGYADGDQRLQLARSAALSFASKAYTNPSGASREAIDDYSVQYAEMSSEMQASPFLVSALRRQYGRAVSSAHLVNG